MTSQELASKKTNEQKPVKSILHKLNNGKIE